MGTNLGTRLLAFFALAYTALPGCAPTVDLQDYPCANPVDFPAQEDTVVGLYEGHGYETVDGVLLDSTAELPEGDTVDFMYIDGRLDGRSQYFSLELAVEEGTPSHHLVAPRGLYFGLPCRDSGVTLAVTPEGNRALSATFVSGDVRDVRWANDTEVLGYTQPDMVE